MQQEPVQEASQTALRSLSAVNLRIPSSSGEARNGVTLKMKVGKIMGRLRNLTAVKNDETEKRIHVYRKREFACDIEKALN